MNERTDLEKITMLNEAIDELLEGRRLEREANEKLKQIGFKIVGIPDEKEARDIHLYCGIKPMAKLLNAEIVPFEYPWGEKATDTFMIEYGDCRMFQIAEVTETVKKVKFK